jgi:beta-lactamase class A
VIWRAIALVILVGGVSGLSLAFLGEDATAVDHPTKPVANAAPNLDTTALDTPAPPIPPAVAVAPVPLHPTFDALATQVNAIIAGSGGQVSVSLIELGGPDPGRWEVGGSVQMDAASTYKLAALMDEAQLIAKGTIDPAGQVCYQDGDWEDGWYTDYTAGVCLTRNDLAWRAGTYSDNTAGHMLVRDVGGASALNAYSAQLGATDSSFFDSNLTTADDLATLLASEATGNAGGSKSTAWLYPKLTNTAFEAGIPAGVPAAGTLVVHKTGELGSTVNDAGLVSGNKSGPYALAVMTNGPGGDAGWSVVAQISAAVWAYEAGR